MSDQENPNRYWKWGLVTLASVILVFVTVSLGVLAVFGTPDSSNEFGDAFGAVNALFSALAFAFVILTLLIQIREMRQNFLEFQETRVVHEKTSQLQHYSTLVNAIATHRELSESRDFHPERLRDNPPEIQRMLVNAEHREELRLIIQALEKFDGRLSDHVPRVDRSDADWRTFTSRLDFAKELIELERKMRSEFPPPNENRIDELKELAERSYDDANLCIEKHGDDLLIDDRFIRSLYELAEQDISVGEDEPLSMTQKPRDERIKEAYWRYRGRLGDVRSQYVRAAMVQLGFVPVG